MPIGDRAMSLDVRLYVDVDTGSPELHRCYLYEANYTHNCIPMAIKAGIYEYVWRPEECCDVAVAGDLVEPLRTGVKLMEDDPNRFKALNPKNGWGDYDTFLEWLRKYLVACIENPNAKIRVSR
jgi:hypothetical protein